jgi:predicted exporter
MKPSWPWLVLSSAGTFSKGTAEERPGERTVFSDYVRPTRKPNVNSLFSNAAPCGVCRLMVNGFAAQRLLLRGYLSIGIVR